MQDRVAAGAERFWDHHFKSSGHVRDWLAIPYVQSEYINPSISGSRDVSWLEFASERYIRGAGTVLELGCGADGPGLVLCRSGAVRRIVGVDVSPEAIRQAQERACAEGFEDRVDYRCVNATTVEFKDGQFDAVLMSMSLHHVLELEDMLSKVQRWKKPSAPFIVNEYVGPDRFQWTDATLREGQRMLVSLGERYRRHGVTGEIVRTFRRPAYAEMVKGDASEAIRSAAIVPLIETYFDVIERRDYGGTILHWLLADIAHNFDPERLPQDALVLDRLFAEERRLLREGVIESNFAVIVAR